MKNLGTRKEVMKREAKQTGGGLKIDDLMYNKYGKIVSKKMSNKSTEKYRLQYNNLLIGGVNNRTLGKQLQHVPMTQQELQDLQDRQLDENLKKSFGLSQQHAPITQQDLQVLRDELFDLQESLGLNMNNMNNMRKKTTFNSRKPKLVRQNTNIHSSKYGICYMFSNFSLINNIKNNILKDSGWVNINIETETNLMVLLYLIYNMYYVTTLGHKIHPQLRHWSFMSFLNMLYDLSHGKKKNFIPEDYNKEIRLLFVYLEEGLNDLLPLHNIPASSKKLIITMIKKVINRNINTHNISNDIMNNNILDNFITRISFLSDFKLYNIHNKKIELMNRLYNINKTREIKNNREFIYIDIYKEFEDIDTLFYEVLKTKQFISIAFNTTKATMSKILHKQKQNKTEIIKVSSNRVIPKINKINESIHSVVITDIMMKDEKEEPKLLNGCYIYKFKNNWGDTWYDEGYGYLTLDSFFISAISFFIDEENIDTIDKIINSILNKKYINSKQINTSK